MSPSAEPDTGMLIEQAARGDTDARQRLLDRHRARLRQVVAVRMDRRIAARIDPSDVVQETLADAARELDDYLSRRPLPYFAWLRQFAWDRLIDLHRRHVRAQNRSVDREEPWPLPLPDESVSHLARRLVASGTSPSGRMERDELRERVRTALEALPARDREVLVMRHLEQLDNSEIAAVLSLSEGAVRTRHVRALQRLRALLGDGADPGERP